MAGRGDGGDRVLGGQTNPLCTEVTLTALGSGGSVWACFRRIWGYISSPATDQRWAGSVPTHTATPQFVQEVVHRTRRSRSTADEGSSASGGGHRHVASRSVSFSLSSSRSTAFSSRNGMHRMFPPRTWTDWRVCTESPSPAPPARMRPSPASARGTLRSSTSARPWTFSASTITSSPPHVRIRLPSSQGATNGTTPTASADSAQTSSARRFIPPQRTSRTWRDGGIGAISGTSAISTACQDRSTRRGSKERSSLRRDRNASAVSTSRLAPDTLDTNYDETVGCPGEASPTS